MSWFVSTVCLFNVYILFCVHTVQQISLHHRAALNLINEYIFRQCQCLISLFYFCRMLQNESSPRALHQTLVFFFGTN